MKTNQYILATDILKLTDAEYESFRNYIRLIGHMVTEVHGRKETVTGYGNEYALMLNEFFNKTYYLRWNPLEVLTDYERLSPNDLANMIQLGMIE